MKNNKKKENFDKFVGKIEVDKSMLVKTNGGKVRDGWIPSVSGECMVTPRSCWHLSTWF
jgi:hypothetical protein